MLYFEATLNSLGQQSIALLANLGMSEGVTLQVTGNFYRENQCDSKRLGGEVGLFCLKPVGIWRQGFNQ